MVAERRDRFTQPPAAVRFLFGGRHLVADGCQQQQRQRGDEHERVKREFAEMAPRGRPLVRRDASREIADGNHIREHDGDQAVERQLQRDRDNRLPQRRQTEEARRDQHRDREAGPQQDAGHQRRPSAPGEGSDQRGFRTEKGDDGDEGHGDRRLHGESADHRGE